MSVPIIALFYHYAFGEAAFDTEHLLATASLILCVALVFIIFLLNFWSVNAHVFMTYSNISNTQKNSIENCTHVKIVLNNLKQHSVKRFIAPIIQNMIVTGSGNLTKTY